MIHSFKLPHWVLRIGLATVFMWFGVHKFINPEFWVAAWIPQSVLGIVAALGMSAENFIFLNGIFEVLVSASLISGYFIRIFSAAAVFFLILVVAFHVSGPTEIVIRDVGLIGGLLTLVLWPERTEL